MKILIFFCTFISILAINPGIMRSQTLHTVSVGGSTLVFTPKNLTITVNDTVRWINISGDHNVVADDNSFTSGPPSTSNWVYDHVFTAEGNNPYYCVVHGGPGGSGMSGVVTVLNPVSVFNQYPIVNKFDLEQNYPNPFNPSTTIEYSIPIEANVTLNIFDILGREIETLVNEEKPAGTYKLTWNAPSRPSGVYFYKLQEGTFVETKKMLLLK